MENKTAILMAIFISYGIILMGFLGYMYDIINKNNYFEDKYKNDFFDMIRFMVFISFTPIIFIHLSIKNKNYKYIIIVILFFIFIITTYIIGIKMVMI
jgi:hypothetical protein